MECALCPHRCLIDEGKDGMCRARGVRDGALVSLNYGRVCARMVDQIEKKPIYHFRPGSKLLSLGTFGCNLDCDCCQNAAVARSGLDEVKVPEETPEDMVGLALEKGAQGMAFTFNEPVVWSEFVMDTAHTARDSGLYTMMNTNGFIEPGPLHELASMVDVFKVDVKGFTEAFYSRHCGGSLAPVLRTCEHLYRNGNHLELAYLIIPGLNDSKDELDRFFSWAVAGLGPQVPVHLYRFMPAHRLSHLKPTDLFAMREARSLAMERGLEFVYVSGMVGNDHTTVCPSCRSVAITREAKEEAERIVYEGRGLSKFCPSYSDVTDLTNEGRCRACGHIICRVQ